MPSTPVFPGPVALGRGVVVLPEDELPAVAAAWPATTIDIAVLEAPAAATAQLDAWWRSRTPSVIELAVPFAALKEPERSTLAPYELGPSFEFERERLHFLVWANRYDGRGGVIRWHHAERAVTLGASPSESADVEVEGQALWVDGGPRAVSVDGLTILHVEKVWSGGLSSDRAAVPVSELAPDQLAAVAHDSGPARVIAPAGSGKTRVLTERLRHLVEDRRWEATSITALAYNRRAADEMRRRLSDVAGGSIRTLHAFGYEILGRARGGRRPRLATETEVRRILDRMAPVRPRANEDVHAPYLEALSEVRIALRAPDTVEAERDDTPGLAALFDPFRKELAERGTIDHDEQIYGAVEALLADPDLRRWARARCRHLLVDEFQDLTPAHLLMIRLVSSPGYDVFGVGDDDQVIYGYAGATPDYLLDYDGYFPGAARHQLEVNYRCPASVVGAAINLLSRNRRRVSKTVRAAKANGPAPDVTLVAEEEMGEAIVEEIRGLVETAGPDSVAVLTRVNVGLLVPQVSLAEAGIAADIVLGPELLSRSGVRAALAWMRLAAAAASGEAMAGGDLAEAIRRPPRSLSPGVRSALGRGSWTLDRLASFATGSDDTRTRDRLGELTGDIARLARAKAESAGDAALLTLLRDDIGLGTVLDRLDNSRARPTGGHTDDLDALIVLAHTHPDKTDFEAWLRLTLDRKPEEGPAVTLSTIHRVKGLEWPHVVVWDASVGMMPHRLATDIEEERRIFHVALTRCSESVTVIGRAMAPSPFLSQLNEAGSPSPEPPAAAPALEAEVGLTLSWQGYQATVVDIEPAAAVVTVGAASRLRIAWGEIVAVAGRRGRLAPPARAPADPALLERLKEWRRRRAATDGVPPYVIAHDSHLSAIATRAPTTLAELAACEGIGPARLERYGDEILAEINPG